MSVAFFSSVWEAKADVPSLYLLGVQSVQLSVVAGQPLSPLCEQRELFRVPTHPAVVVISLKAQQKL